jgi:hypothetical protein
MLSGWRGLGAFWLVVLLLVGGTAVVLQTLGPPAGESGPATPPRVAAAAKPVPPPAAPLVSATREVPPADRPGRDVPGPIADPDPALLVAAPGATTATLPRIADDGRRPMQVYAAGFDRSSRRPRVAILLAGIGLNEQDSMRAIRDLPGAVTLAISPYAAHLPRLLTAARLAEHEFLLAIPMEPQGFPANDPGPRALMTSVSPAENLDRLHWLLGQVQGYVGVTNALGMLRGERFAGVPEQMSPLLADLARRGLLYVDARPPDAGGQATQHDAWSRDVDLVVDEPPDDIDVKLAQLEQIAHDRGDALGLAGAPTPVTLQHLIAWANGLLDRGLALAPVTALARPPADLAAAGK